MLPHYPLLINGEQKDTREKNDVVNPCTGEAIATVSVASQKEIELTIFSARQAFAGGLWRQFGLAERKGFLLKIAQGILAKAGELAQLESLHTGKPIKETTFMDIPSSAATFEYFANHLEQLLQEENISINSQIAHAQSILRREPRGVTVLIVPWNYPLLIASWKMAQSLAAGNTVILKPSSLTPLTALELGKICIEAGLPAGVVNVVTGPGDIVGEQLCRHASVDMISFTGSNSVGKKILEYTSRNVKKVIMELGGKSASIVLADADIELAVNGSLCSIFLNQGQMCTAMSRIFVQDSIYETFVNDFTKKAQRIKLGDSLDFETQMGPLVSKAQQDSVIHSIEQAKKQGAEVLCGGKVSADEKLKKGFFFEPTVITNVTERMNIFREEVFGPVVCIGKFSHTEEAITMAHASDFALAGCIWTKDVSLGKSLACKLDAGTIWINTYGMFFDELPYGGFKQSGFGKELGKEGFLEYTRLKNIVIDQASDGKPLVHYWYGF